MTSHFGQYIFERLGKHILENEKGFMTYSINGKECYIEDVWIHPDFRKLGVASDFMKIVSNVAKEKGCTFLTGSVAVQTNSATDSLKVLLSVGFKVVSAQNNAIIFAKEI